MSRAHTSRSIASILAALLIVSVSCVIAQEEGLSSQEIRLQKAQLILACFQATDVDPKLLNRSSFAACKQAALTGHPYPMEMLGFMYRHGFGVGSDLLEAYAWYHRALDSVDIGTFMSRDFTAQDFEEKRTSKNRLMEDKRGVRRQMRKSIQDHIDHKVGMQRLEAEMNHTEHWLNCINENRRLSDELFDVKLQLAMQAGTPEAKERLEDCSHRLTVCTAKRVACQEG